MTSCEETIFAALDEHVRDQLDRAADVHASNIDIEARLKMIFQAGSANQKNDSAAAAEG